MIGKNALATAATKIKHEHCYVYSIASFLYKKIEGAQAWFQLTLKHDIKGFQEKIKAYYENVVLKCPGRTKVYLAILHQHLTQHLKSYGELSLN